MADIETRIRSTLRLVREALSALEKADLAVLREAAERVQRASHEVAKRKLDAMFMPELHQARWVERLAQLRDKKALATTPGEREAIEARIREHYDHRHDLEQTRGELEANYEASAADRLAIPEEGPDECLRRIEGVLAAALKRLQEG